MQIGDYESEAAGLRLNTSKEVRDMQSEMEMAQQIEKVRAKEVDHYREQGEKLKMRVQELEEENYDLHTKMS
jgi:uncharacterized coiled-coil DUF342 family protein